VPVVVSPGQISRGDQAEAGRLLVAAQASFQARRLQEALRTVADILDRFESADASGDALRLRARAEYELGSLERAEASAGEYLALLSDGDVRGTEMRLLQADALAGDPEEQLDRLLRIDSGATDEEIERARPVAVAASDSLSLEALESVVAGIEGRGPLFAIAGARLSVGLLEADRVGAARVFAQSTIESGAGGEELAWAEGVLRGELPEGRGRTTTFQIGVVLPMGGPPALAEFASLIAEGIEVAAATVLGEEFSVTVVTRDDEGDPALSAQSVESLEAEGVAGVIGLLQDESLVAAGMSRDLGLPLVSPTARSAAQAGDGVYSLEGADAEAAASVARYAASRAFQRVAIVYPQTPDARAEADAFEAAAAALGIPVVGRFTYEAGATFFESQILSARDSLRMVEVQALGLGEDDTLHVEMLEPVALFLPIPPEDVEFLAPQVSHFGLDTLAIEILGTSGWTDPQTLEVVDTRHTNGVVATAPTGTGAESVGRQRFRQAYEDYFQRSLVGETAGIGYDATLLLLEALRPGRIRPGEVHNSFRGLAGVEGATGLFSVIEGRVVRETGVVRINNRIPVPIEVR
jgi:ABC-type branched-subunit amino acid transport system substrate-binding protein